MLRASELLHAIAALPQLRRDRLDVIALNLDLTRLRRSARTAALLQLGREFSERVGRELEPDRHRYALSRAALPVDADANRLR